MAAICNNDDYNRSTRLLAATTLRNVLGTRNLSEILSDREAIGETMHRALSTATSPWGVHVDRVEIKVPTSKLALRTSVAAAGVKREDSHQKVHAKTHGLGNMHINMLGNMHVNMLGNMLGNMHVMLGNIHINILGNMLGNMRVNM